MSATVVMLNLTFLKYLLRNFKFTIGLHFPASFLGLAKKPEMTSSELCSTIEAAPFSTIAAASLSKIALASLSEGGFLPIKGVFGGPALKDNE